MISEKDRFGREEHSTGQLKLGSYRAVLGRTVGFGDAPGRSPVFIAKEVVDAHPGTTETEWVPGGSGERITESMACLGMCILKAASKKAVDVTSGRSVEVTCDNHRKRVGEDAITQGPRLGDPLVPVDLVFMALLSQWSAR